jgi:uncharacterized membrane protein
MASVKSAAEKGSESKLVELLKMPELSSPALACPECAAEMPPTAAFCPGCGRAMQVVPKVQGRVGFFPRTIAGALAYFTFIPAIVFLMLDPYRRDRFVRFHSIQCLLLWLAGLIAGLAIRVLALILFMVPVVGVWLISLLSVLAGLAAFFMWLVLVVKALQGYAFKLSILGDLAEHYAPPL